MKCVALHIQKIRMLKISTLSNQNLTSQSSNQSNKNRKINMKENGKDIKSIMVGNNAIENDRSSELESSFTLGSQLPILWLDTYFPAQRQSVMDIMN